MSSLKSGVYGSRVSAVLYGAEIEVTGPSTEIVNITVNARNRKRCVAME